MPELNLSIPHWQCYLRRRFLFDCNAAEEGEPVPVLVIGVASIPGRALGFHCLTEDGGLFWRMPIQALQHSPLKGIPEHPLADLQVWDCFSAYVTHIIFDRLDMTYVRAKIGSREIMGKYFMTIDWYGLGSGAEGVGDDGHKCAHIIALDDGNYAALPNNYLRWHDKAFNVAPDEFPKYKTNTHIWKCENGTTPIR